MKEVYPQPLFMMFERCRRVIGVEEMTEGERDEERVGRERGREEGGRERERR